MNTNYYEPDEDVLLERFEHFCEANGLDESDEETHVLFERHLDDVDEALMERQMDARREAREMDDRY